MGTPRQIQSARRNGAKSVGPVTSEGKAISATNAIKHGLLAEAVVISGESPEHLAALSARFHAEFHPRTQVETHHVETMIMCRWRLHRLWEFESATLNQEIDRLAAVVDAGRRRGAQAFRNLSEHSRSLDLLTRYETNFARAFLRAHKALMELKAKEVPDWSDHIEHSVLNAVDDTPAKNEILRNEPDSDPNPVL